VFSSLYSRVYRNRDPDIIPNLVVLKMVVPKTIGFWWSQ
jgi:hypothetical protein